MIKPDQQRYFRYRFLIRLFYVKTGGCPVGHAACISYDFVPSQPLLTGSAGLSCTGHSCGDHRLLTLRFFPTKSTPAIPAAAIAHDRYPAEQAAVITRIRRRHVFGILSQLFCKRRHAKRKGRTFRAALQNAFTAERTRSLCLSFRQ